MKDYEKLGSFYLGKIFDPVKKEVTDDLVLYDSKDLTTHAVIVGMTGSGKTGLGIDLIEEAALDKIPSILIDPKGDLGNLLLTFPSLAGKDFLPWIDAGEAERSHLTPEQYAEKMAKTWKDGLKSWGEDAARIKKLKDTVEMAIYTPASQAGIPLSIVSSFAAPTKEMILDTGALRERVLSITSSLLGLLGIAADPINSREHILIASIIDKAWRQEKDLDISQLIQLVQKPPFDKIGALDVDTFFPPKDRMALAITLNNLLASPGFQAWMEGEPLDIDRLLYTPEGKPKISIISIAHLSDPERMFFVTLLLNQLVSWMRKQPGTSTLRALFYMDEIFGYFPPVAMPPSKTPLLTILKQARAYGLGTILATQNPVDLDYKGLSNCGTWFIGKLQTERDRSRVIEGLNSASNGDLDSQALNKMLSALGKRIFIMRSIYEKDPILFQTRWTLSYLGGPLTLTQIKKLTDQSSITRPSNPEPKIKEVTGAQEVKPNAPTGITEYFANPPGTNKASYEPRVGGFAKIHYVNAKFQVDRWEDICIVAPLSERDQSVAWHDGVKLTDYTTLLDKEPLPNSQFGELPSTLAKEKNYSLFEKSLSSWLYQNENISIYTHSELELISSAEESEADFRTRVALALREKRDAAVNKLREKYSKKIETLNQKVRKAQEKMTLQQQQANIQKTESYISIGSTILGAILGKGVGKGTISQAGTTMRRMGRVDKEAQEAAHAAEDYKSLQDQLLQLQNELAQEISQMPESIDPTNIPIEKLKITPRKSDLSIENIALVWWTN